MTKASICEWLNIYNLNDFNYLESNIVITDNNEVDVDCDVLLKNVFNLPFKFGNINGRFIIEDGEINSSRNLPNSITKYLFLFDFDILDKTDWPLKEIGGTIQINGDKPSKIEDLDFLIETKFDYIYALSNGNYFKDNIIPNKYKEYIEYGQNENEHDNIISYKSFQNMIKDGVVNYKVDIESIDSYYDSFDSYDMEID